MKPEEIRKMESPCTATQTPSQVEFRWFALAREAVAQLAEIKEALWEFKARGQGYGRH